jgi:hypothetical protein
MPLMTAVFIILVYQYQLSHDDLLICIFALSLCAERAASTEIRHVMISLHTTLVGMKGHLRSRTSVTCATVTKKLRNIGDHMKRIAHASH